MPKINLVPALESEVTLGVGLSVSGFLVQGREFRYGVSYVSELLGHAENYFRQSLSGSIKTPSKKLKALRLKGFTAYKVKVKAPRKEGGGTIADTISFDDFSIWVEYEAIEEKNPRAIALLTSSFREVLLGRTLEAFGLSEQSNEEKIQQFSESFEEREAIWEEHHDDLEALRLPGDEDGYELISEADLLLSRYQPLFYQYGIDAITV